jgi:Leucine-rich repeat (LRR) protein
VSKDLEIIKELEKKIGNKLDHYYSIDENENIIGVNLSRLEISDITSLRDLKNLTHLDLNHNQISDISPLKNLKNVDINLTYNDILACPLFFSC